jgi:hypothetical protein
MKKSDATDDLSEAHGPARKLGLSKIVYGLGMSARDALVTFVVATIAIAPFIYKGQGKGGFIDKVALWPDKIHSKWKEVLGDRAGKAGKALVISASIATIISWVAHLPGLFRGPQKIEEARNTFNDEVEANHQLGKENAVLTEELKRKTLALAAAEKKSSSFTQRLKASEPANSNTLSL